MSGVAEVACAEMNQFSVKNIKHYLEGKPIQTNSAVFFYIRSNGRPPPTPPLSNVKKNCIFGSDRLPQINQLFGRA